MFETAFGSRLCQSLPGALFNYFSPKGNIKIKHIFWILLLRYRDKDVTLDLELYDELLHTDFPAFLYASAQSLHSRNGLVLDSNSLRLLNYDIWGKAKTFPTAKLLTAFSGFMQSLKF